MDNVDVIEKVVTEEPELPVHVPYANYSSPGIASFNSTDFHVEQDGEVQLSKEIKAIREDAEEAAAAAASSAEEAGAQAEQAKTYMQSAQTAASDANNSALSASGSAVQSSAYAEQAKQSAQAAADSAEEAEGYKDTATQQSQAAASSASAAAQSASNAVVSANTATDAKSAAQTAAQNAEQFATNAETFADNAETSASQAANSALLAQQYRDQAKDYAQKHYAVYPSFDALPVPGDSAFIYLVPAEDGGENNSYTEYLWITETSSYESIGSVNDIDLSGYAQINGTYAGMTVGNATNAQTAQNAQQLGGVAASQYAQISGTYSGMTVGKATNADNATKATQDASGNVITETYATKADVDASVVDLGTLVVGSNTISSALVQAALDEKCVFIKFALENTILYLPKATTASSAEAATFGFANYDSSLVSYMVGISGTTAIVSYNEIDVATEAQVNAKYTKPSSGIPESDLSADVQTSLGKADTAYQKPSTGIPESDLASAVQTSLGKADTALQSVPLATSSAIGGVKPVAKTDDMTQSVGVDANGALFTAPSGGGSIEYMTDDEVDALFN